MEKELQKQEDTSNRLQSSRDRMAQTIHRLNMDLDLAKQKSVEYGKRHERQRGSLTGAQDRTKVLERSLMHVLRECEVDREDRDMQGRQELEDASRQLEELKHEAQSKSEEMKFLTAHAKTVLRQRSEVERFFLEEIQKCDEYVKSRRMLNHKAAKVNHNRAIRSLAAVPDDEGFWAGGDQVGAQLPFEAEPIQVLGLDRARLLRLVYSKINNAGPQLFPPSFEQQQGNLLKSGEHSGADASRPDTAKRRSDTDPSFFLTQESSLHV
jgi:hypothetical protein